MAGTGKIYINGRNADKFSDTKLKSIVDCPIISSAKGVVAATGVVECVQVPAGAYVYQVGLYATTVVAAADLDVGYGNTAGSKDKFIDGLTTLAAGDIAMSGLGGLVTADPVGGHYFASADTIDLWKVATGTTGSVKILVWYFVA